MSSKILYVEDELFLAKIVKESLESRGYQVVMESDGAEVLQRFNQMQPDICLLDVMLPNKNGFELASEIRRTGSTIPLIFLTAKTQTDDVLQGFRSGGNDFIRKPFSMEELIARIQNALRFNKDQNPGEVMQDVLPFGAYQVYLKRQTLVFNNTERKLSYRETELLKLLWQYRDQIIERKKVLQVIWGNDSFFNSRNLDVYITRLRSYLREDVSIEILTIKGVGYRLVY